MTNHLDASRPALRRSVYWLLIITSLGSMAGRILVVQADHGQTPFLSANDRSRWCTIRTLVDDGTFAIDSAVLNRSGGFDRRWHTIDMVKHKDWDGYEHYFSSKPTLLPTLLAGQYWLIQKITGATLADDPFLVGRVMLIVSNVLPMLLYFVLLARLVEQLGTTDWGRIFVMMCATWGTFLTTFAVTLNNHLPAAISVLIAVYAAIPIWRDGERRWRYFAAAGLFSAFAAANELPALSFFALLAAVLLVRSPLRTLFAFGPAAAIIFAGFFVTNYAAHGTWNPAYANRHDGKLLVSVNAALQSELNDGIVPDVLRTKLKELPEQPIDISPAATVSRGPIPETPKRSFWKFWQADVKPVAERWVLWDREGHDRLAIVHRESASTLDVHAWGNWYEYDRSYWMEGRKTGVDLGEPSRAVYAFNVLVGHYGFFSLTPIWLVSLGGLAIFVRSRDRRMRGFAMMVVLLTVVCLAFYIMRPLKDRNYAGVACGFRWLFWLIPMWLVCLLPAADWMSSNRAWRIIALVLLLISVVSATYGALNPWIYPWLYTFCEYIEIWRWFPAPEIGLAILNELIRWATVS